MNKRMPISMLGCALILLANIVVFSTASAQEIDNSVKPRLHPGHYLMYRGGSIRIDEDLYSPQLDEFYASFSDDSVLRASVKGLIIPIGWHSLEPNPPVGWSPGEPVPTDPDAHVFEWEMIDRVMAWLDQRGLKAWVEFGHKTWLSTANHVAPEWARADFERSGADCETFGQWESVPLGNIVPLWHESSRQALEVVLRAFVKRYGEDPRLGVLSFPESSPWCPHPGLDSDRMAYAEGQLSLSRAAREEAPTLNIIQNINWGEWRYMAEEGFKEVPPIGVGGPDVHAYGDLYSVTHPFVSELPEEIPIYWQVQYEDLHWISCRSDLWRTELPQCNTDGTNPCNAKDVACYLTEYMNADAIGWVAFEDRKEQIFGAIKEYARLADSTPPSAPANLQGAASNNSAEGLSIALNWVESTDDGSGVKEYHVQRDGAIIGSTSSLYYTDNLGVLEQTHVYTILAEDHAGNLSGASNNLTVRKPCTRNALSFRITMGLKTGRPGETLSFPYVVTNNDGAGCAPTNFTISLESRNTGRSGLMSLSPGETVTRRLFLTVPENADDVFVQNLVLRDLDSHHAPVTQSVTVIIETYPDSDDDSILDKEDNCLFSRNPDQRDTDADGYGNKCDADLNNDEVINIADYFIMLGEVGKTGGNLHADLNGDLRVDAQDFWMLIDQFNKAPGPSGLNTGR